MLILELLVRFVTPFVPPIGFDPGFLNEGTIWDWRFEVLLVGLCKYGIRHALVVLLKKKKTKKQKTKNFVFVWYSLIYLGSSKVIWVQEIYYSSESWV